MNPAIATKKRGEEGLPADRGLADARVSGRSLRPGEGLRLDEGLEGRSVWTVRVRVGVFLGTAAVWVGLSAGDGRARAQGPTVPAERPTFGVGGQRPPLPPGGRASSLGPLPGSGGNVLGNRPGQGGPVLGGRPGVSSARVPTTITGPGGTNRPTIGRGNISPPPLVLPAPLANSGSLEMPIEPIDDGPPNGWTLDQAIERLARGNLDLMSKSLEIPQADADILTASLRANPFLYADSQLVPYGNYSRLRPGGQTQYDLNVSLPLDVTHKRLARTAYAVRAKQVLIAQYQDALRLSIDNLYVAFVDVLAARETAAFSRASVLGLGEILKNTELLREGGEKTSADIARVRGLLASARVGLRDAETSLAKTKQTLASLLSIPASQAHLLEVRGSLRDETGFQADFEKLAALALANRPDVRSYRNGIQAAQANLNLQHANRYNDVYLLLQPYTFQSNAPFHLKSSTSWAVGMTVPLPIFNRNQGEIQRARLNVNQTRIEEKSIEFQVMTEVGQAIREFDSTRESLREIVRDVLPEAKNSYESTKLQQKERADFDVLFVLNSRQEYNNAVRQYRDFQIRHRRSMLALNTAVGLRLLP